MNANDDSFEGFRRERRRRQLETGGPRRDLGARGSILREIERAEAEELREQQITRDVHEFFAEATRVAADILSRVAGSREDMQRRQIQDEMVEFLNDAIERAQELVQVLRADGSNARIGTKEFAANMQNIVGPLLDEFRYEGTAHLEDKHIGQDPFAEAAPDARGDATAEEPPSLGIEDHLVAQLHRVAGAPTPASVRASRETAPGDDTEAGAHPPQAPEFLVRMRNHPKKLAAALKSMVANGLMTKQEAIELFESLRS